MTRLGVSMFMAVLVAFTVTGSATEPSRPLADAEEALVREAYGKVPLSFEGNRGQTVRRVRYLARGRGYTLFLTPTETVLTLVGGRGTPGSSEVRMHLVGAHPAPSIAGELELAGRSHYFVGDDPLNWRHGILRYQRVRYREVYPGIDLVYYGDQERLEYDFVVGVHADPRVIQLEFPGASGLLVDEGGDLVLQLDGAQLVQRKPVIHQDVNGIRRFIEGGYHIDERSRVSFEVGDYDESRPLVIDPVLLYATYLGGAAATDVGDIGFSIGVDDAGSSYVIGTTRSLDFPVTAGAIQPAIDGGPDPRDIFVTKLNVDGTEIVFSTYLGGSGIEGGTIALDASGSVYVAGLTTSSDFPTTLRAYKRTMTGPSDAFVTKLSPDGAEIVFSTYLGGSGTDSATSLALGDDGALHLGGWTTSGDFPTSKQALQREYAGGSRDAIVATLNDAGTRLVHSTYLGGSGGDIASDIDVAVDGSVYVTGSTRSVDFPTSAGALQPMYAGSGDAFVARLNGSLKRIVYSTYLGGGRDDQARAIAVDASGRAHVTGGTLSVDFPTTPGAFQPALAIPGSGPTDAFVTKLAPGGGQLVYSTYLGGGNDDSGRDITLDADGCAYVTGGTDSLDFPNTPDALQPTNATPCFGNICTDAFLTKLCDPGTDLCYSSYFGGSGHDHANAIALDRDASIYLTGETTSFDLPTTPGAPQPGNAGGPIPRDAFVAKIGFPASCWSHGEFVMYDQKAPRIPGALIPVSLPAAGQPRRPRARFEVGAYDESQRERDREAAPGPWHR